MQANGGDPYEPQKHKKRNVEHQPSATSDDAVVVNPEEQQTIVDDATDGVHYDVYQNDESNRRKETSPHIDNDDDDHNKNKSSSSSNSKLGAVKEMMGKSSSLPSSSSSSNDDTESHHNNLNHFSEVTRSIMSKLRFSGDSKTAPPPADQLIYKNMTPIGHAAYHTLSKNHAKHRKESWNLTQSYMVGGLWNTPQGAFDQNNMIPPSAAAAANRSYQQPSSTCPSQPHDEFLPKQMGDMIAMTRRWCDITSLSPPDGHFFEHFQRGLLEICQREKELANGERNRIKENGRRITVRLLFGNIVGTPIDCNAFIEVLTNQLPLDAGDILQLWVGSWRKGVSWNHSKIIAVDGKHLWTGGHNLWTYHYCMADPVHDVSLRLQGDVASDGHLFANRQWGYIARKQTSCWGHFVDHHVPDAWEVPRVHRVTVSEFPFQGGATEFPPPYQPIEHINPESKQGKMIKTAKKRLLKKIRNNKNKKQQQKDGNSTKNDKDKENENNSNDDDDAKQSLTKEEESEHDDNNKDKNDNTDDNDKQESPIPILSIGRYGRIVHLDRPADDALVAMMDACQSSIRLAVQDIGPMQIPGVGRPVPGTMWPKKYLNALGRAIWKRRVDVEIVLSNPDSLPGHLDGPGEFVYGNGWKTWDVADEIVMAIKRQFQFQGVTIEELRDRIRNNLRICYLRAAPQGTTNYPCGQTIGLHAKHYIFDDTTCYIGSQNLYDCDLAEWGVVLDSPAKVQELKESYWDLMWQASYRKEDCSVDQVIDNLKIDREAPNRVHLAWWRLKSKKGITPFHCGCCQTAEAVVTQEQQMQQKKQEKKQQKKQQPHEPPKKAEKPKNTNA